MSDDIDLKEMSELLDKFVATKEVMETPKKQSRLTSFLGSVVATMLVLAGIMILACIIIALGKLAYVMLIWTL